MKNALASLLPTGIPETTAFGLERGIRKAHRIPQEINATPSLEDLVYKYAAARSKEAVGEKELATTIELANKKMSETARESNINFAMQRDALDRWKSDNNLATLLGLAGTAVHGLGGLAALKKQEQRDVKQQDILDTMKGTITSQKDYLAGAETRQNEFFKDLIAKVLTNRSKYASGMGVYEPGVY